MLVGFTLLSLLIYVYLCSCIILCHYFTGICYTVVRQIKIVYCVLCRCSMFMLKRFTVVLKKFFASLDVFLSFFL